MKLLKYVLVGTFCAAIYAPVQATQEIKKDDASRTWIRNVCWGLSFACMVSALGYSHSNNEVVRRTSLATAFALVGQQSYGALLAPTCIVGLGKGLGWLLRK